MFFETSPGGDNSSITSSLLNKIGTPSAILTNENGRLFKNMRRLPLRRGATYLIDIFQVNLPSPRGFVEQMQ